MLSSHIEVASLGVILSVKGLYFSVTKTRGLCYPYQKDIFQVFLLLEILCQINL